MLSVNEINLLQSQNEGLKKQNKELQEEIKKIRENKCTDCIQHLITKSQKQAIEKATKIFKVLQEIKSIAEEHINTRMLLSDKKSFLEFNNIYKLITKAEEE